MSLTTRLFNQINYDVDSVADFANPAQKVNRSTLHLKMLNGTGSNQADLVFADQRTIGVSANEDLDLSGTLTDPLGATLAFVKIKAILITAAVANTNSVVIKPAAANGFLGPFNAAADTVTLPPGGSFMVTAPAGGWTVTASTADLLNVANSAGGTSVLYDVIIIGTSA